MESNDDAIKYSRKNVRTWLFNPFLYIAGGEALGIGIACIMVAGFVGSISNSHFDGVLDFHSGASAPLWIFFMEGLIDWILLGGLIFWGGLIISKSRFRAIDVFGTQALARFPTVITTIAALLPGFNNFAKKLASQPANLPAVISNNMNEFYVFLIVIIIIIIMAIWMVYLMYRAFSISCNVSGGKAILVFIGILISSEIVSKFLFMSFVYSNYLSK